MLTLYFGTNTLKATIGSSKPHIYLQAEIYENIIYLSEMLNALNIF